MGADQTEPPRPLTNEDWWAVHAALKREIEELDARRKEAEDGMRLAIRMMHLAPPVPAGPVEEQS